MLTGRAQAAVGLCQSISTAVTDLCYFQEVRNIGIAGCDGEQADRGVTTLSSHRGKKVQGIYMYIFQIFFFFTRQKVNILASPFQN